MFRTSLPALSFPTGLVNLQCAVLNGLPEIVLMAFLVFLSAPRAAAQATVEYGHAIAGAGVNVTGLTKAINSALSPGKKLDSTPLPEKPSAVAPPIAENLDATNRQALEQHAGKDPAKLTLKSVPAKASVRIDGKTVGQTPLLLTLAPGAYKVEMVGPRMEQGKQLVELHPQETRELNLTLSSAPRYPSQIWLH
jgi:hypothetical protein